MVERTPIEESKKLSINRNALELIQDCSWEDLRGLSLGFDEDWI